MNESTSLIPEDRKDVEESYSDVQDSCSTGAFIKSIKVSPLKKDQLDKILWSFSLRENLEKDEANLVVATLLLRDAIFLSTKSIFADFDGYNPYIAFDSEWKAKCSKFCRYVLTCKNQLFRKLVFWLGAVGMILLSFLEPPSWCMGFDSNHIDPALNTNERAEGDMCQHLLQAQGPPAFGDTNEIVQYYPNYGITVLSNEQAVTLIRFCLSLVIIDLILIFGKNGFSLRDFLYFRASRGGNAIERMLSSNRSLASKHLAIGRAIRIIEIISVIMLCLETFKSYGNNLSRPFSPLWRGLIFASYSNDVQRELMTSLQLIPSLFGSLFALLLTISVYAWIGVVAFYNSQEGKESFSSLVEGMWTLWTCVTTANYPDVMMSAYNRSRIVVIYFVSFMVITFFFLMNVILGNVVQRYNDQSNDLKETMANLIEHHMNDSFELLDKDNNGTIDRSTIFDLFAKLNELCPDIRFIPEDKMGIMFAILDKDGNNLITKEEYMDFSFVLLLEFHEYAGYTTYVEENFPRIYDSVMYQKFCSMVKSKNFEFLVDVILFLNAIVITIQSYPLLSGQQVEVNPFTRDGSIDTTLEIVETIFTTIYCLEIIIKLIVFGFKRFFESGKNSFDATITFVVLLSTLIVYYPNTFNNPEIIRVVLMVRVLRLLRLLTGMKDFRIIGQTFLEAVPPAKRIITYLLFIMYLVTAVGIANFGGMITQNPDSRHAILLKDTSFADANYWANNFNDFPSGFNTLFNLLIINNWTEMEAGIVSVTESRKSRFFFLFFHIIGVIIINNLVVALVIDTFMEKYGQEKKGDKEYSNSKTVFDASQITGTKTNVAGQYVATLRRSDLSKVNELGKLLNKSIR